MGSVQLSAFSKTEGNMSGTEQWDIENEKGMRLYQQGHYNTAEQTLRVALHEAEQFGPTDTRVAIVLNNLASLYHNQRKLTEAETLYLRALAIRSEAYGPDHRMVAQSLNNLASLYRELGKYQEAKEFSLRAVAIAEAVVGPHHW